MKYDTLPFPVGSSYRKPNRPGHIPLQVLDEDAQS
jgi:hypothetical protein